MVGVIEDAMDERMEEDLRVNDLFNIAFDKNSWKNVSAAEKNALHEHLRVNDLFKYVLV